MAPGKHLLCDALGKHVSGEGERWQEKRSRESDEFCAMKHAGHHVSGVGSGAGSSSLNSEVCAARTRRTRVRPTGAMPRA